MKTESQDLMNINARIVVERLQKADLLDVAERAAKREGLLLRQCITTGEITGGHIALWRALTKEGQTTQQIASIVNFPADKVEREIVKAASRSAPKPEEGRRREPEQFTAPKVLPPIPDLEVPDSDEVPRMSGNFSDAGVPRVFLRPKDHGRAGEIVVEVAHARGVSLRDLAAAERRTQSVSDARGEIVVRLTTELKWSQPDIARLLGIDHSSVAYHQRRNGIAAGRPRNNSKAAA